VGGADLRAAEVDRQDRLSGCHLHARILAG
jgi:hypothetical protein